MKIIGYILAIYIILLSAIPCCSFDNCPDDKTEQSSNHEQGDEDCGNCSPFFTCEGCGGFVSTNELPGIELSPLKPARVYTIFIEQNVPDIHYDFWQPPKLA
jgi:hypothetical protein